MAQAALRPLCSDRIFMWLEKNLLSSNAIISMKRRLSLLILLAGLAAWSAPAQENPGGTDHGYKAERNINYCMVEGKDLKLNAFLPESSGLPAPAIVEIHGGWWHGVDPALAQARRNQMSIIAP